MSESGKLSAVNADALAAIREPFPPDKIGHIPRGGIKIDYVGHAELTDRLLELDPLWNWEPVAWDQDGSPLVRYVKDRAVLWVRVTFAGVTRLGVGTVRADAFEPEKELIGDALRNAMMRFGAALDLWAKSDLHRDTAPPAAERQKKAPDLMTDAQRAKLRKLVESIPEASRESVRDEVAGEVGRPSREWSQADADVALAAYSEIVEAYEAAITEEGDATDG